MNPRNSHPTGLKVWHESRRSSWHRDITTTRMKTHYFRVFLRYPFFRAGLQFSNHDAPPLSTTAAVVKPATAGAIP